MPLTPTDLLDGTVPVRAEGVRFDVLDINRNVLGTLATAITPPTITNDATQRIRRRVTNIIVPPRPIGDQLVSRYYADDLNTLTMRLRATWLLSTGDEYPLGLFLFGDDSAEVWSWGSPRHVIGVDQCTILDDPVNTNIGYPAGTNIGVALTDQAAQAGFVGTLVSIDATTLTLAEPVAWAAGRDTRLTVMESLCALAGFYPPYFDNAGILVCRTAPSLASVTADFAYGFGTVVIDGSIVQSNDLISAPNRYVAVSTSASTGAVVGTFDVPDAAPHSFVNTGRRRTKTITLQAITDATAAYSAAVAAYASDSETYTWLQFSTPPDPRHDTFDIVSFDGVNYRQLGWTLPCKPGATMRHDCRGTYT